MTRVVIPNRRNKMFDYRRPCDRCGFSGWLGSELRREQQTNQLVCPLCLDEPRQDLFERKQYTNRETRTFD